MGPPPTTPDPDAPPAAAPATPGGGCDAFSVDDGEGPSPRSPYWEDNPKMGTKVTKLSVKTTKIMSDYQDYLAELDAAFPPEENSLLESSPGGPVAAAPANRSGTCGASPGASSPGSGGDDPAARDWYFARPSPGASADRTNLVAIREGRYEDDRYDDGRDDDAEMQTQLVRGQPYVRSSWTRPPGERIKRGIRILAGLTLVVGVSIGASVAIRRKGGKRTKTMMAEKYRPEWHARDEGWAGKTWLEALEFCQGKEGYGLCPMEAVCPLGPGTEPLGGYDANDAEGTWVPILDAPNDWISVGAPSVGGTCLRYSSEHSAPPEWGLTGEGSEGITRLLACCTMDVGTEFEGMTPDKSDLKNVSEGEPENPAMSPGEAAVEQTTAKAETPLPTPSPTTPQPTTPKLTNSPTELPTRKPTTRPTISDEEYYKTVVERLEPMWFHRGNGWEGQTYLEALQFCAKENSRIPCPYIAYCPLGTANHPLGGDQEGVSWAPIIDAPNAWVQVGKEDTCVMYNELYRTPPEWGLTGIDDEDLTRHLLCCLEEALEEEPLQEEVPGKTTPFTEMEQVVLDTFKARWYGRDEGYQGTTYADAEKFCANVAGMDLCPFEAYCPNGPIEGDLRKPLFLQLPPLDGEQWSPVKTYNDDEDDSYVLVGTINDNPATTCHTYRHFHDGKMPQWGIDGTSPELKLNVLCCKDPEYFSTGISNPAINLTIGGPGVTDQVPGDGAFDMEALIQTELEPEWLSFDDGWYGGSHSDAEDFCDGRGGKKLCPYPAYCPHGPAQPVSKGHSSDISAEGVQWSPVFGHENHWVMVGQKHGNSATTCFSHEDLEGGPPDWGLTVEQHEIKKYVMCCRLVDLS